MSLWGAWRHHLAGVVTSADTVGEDLNDAVLRTGDLRHTGGDHVCRMFRSHELKELASRTGAMLESVSASNWASLGDQDALAVLEADPDRWSRFLEHEVRACAEPGVVDGGTHILFALTRRP
jgi:hypothetical protein